MSDEDNGGVYTGKFMGHVRDANDPDHKGRLRLFVPEVMGEVDDKDHWTDWALPCFPWFASFGVGAALVPQPGDAWGVWVEFRHGDPRFPVWTGIFPIGASLASADQLRIDSVKLLLGGNASINPVTGEGVVVAGGTDSFTGATYGALGNASTVVFAKKS